MLKRIRRILAVVFFVGITVLSLSLAFPVHKWLGWMADVQFLPAAMALNVVVIAALLLITIIFGRIYCSVICPLGVLQDVFGWLGRRVTRNRYTYSKERVWLRWIVFVIFVFAFFCGFSAIVSLLAPYSSYVRIVQNVFFSSYLIGNYAFAPVAFCVAIVTLIIIAVLSWRGGRTYCNTICPVGTILSVFARFSLFKPVIDKSKCVNCSLCAKNCKASCIDIKGGHKIDYSRCVTCGDCISVCGKGALKYDFAWRKRIAEEKDVKEVKESEVKKKAEGEKKKVDVGRRGLLIAAVGLFAAGAFSDKLRKAFTGNSKGLALRESVTGLASAGNKITTVPPGAESVENMISNCTGCQLCVSACPGEVLVSSTNLFTLNQPQMSYERGYCIEGCTKCSDVCPTSAIKKITVEQKGKIQIGTAVWDAGLCIPLRDGEFCGACGYACPYEAIELVGVDPADENSPLFPVVDYAKCRGCGACENVCPSRPQKAIYVEGLAEHNEIV